MDKETKQLLDDWIAEYQKNEKNLTTKIDGFSEMSLQSPSGPWLRQGLVEDRTKLRVLIEEFEKFKDKASEQKTQKRIKKAGRKT